MTRRLRAGWMRTRGARSLTRAYRAAHPDSTSEVVSSAWREEARERRWRQRATDFDVSFFRDEARRTVALVGRGMRAFARKTIRALLAKEPAMQPASWDDTLKAWQTLWAMVPHDVISAYATVNEDAPKVARHAPEAIYPREVYVEHDEGDEESLGPRVPLTEPRPMPPK